MVEFPSQFSDACEYIEEIYFVSFTVAILQTAYMLQRGWKWKLAVAGKGSLCFYKRKFPNFFSIAMLFMLYSHKRLPTLFDSQSPVKALISASAVILLMAMGITLLRNKMY